MKSFLSLVSMFAVLALMTGCPEHKDGPAEGVTPETGTVNAQTTEPASTPAAPADTPAAAAPVEKPAATPAVKPAAPTTPAPAPKK